ncbi:gp436 family protein [Albidovulum sp.]|uniref:gp436 family protein n=1 Tax=Albidovulum sp. TaxID=1872424 RepID=UPI0039B8E049
MAYAAQNDIIEIYGQQALYVADRDGDGVADTAAVDRALASASAEIDSYLVGRYMLPLHEVPAILRQLCVDIGIYRLALSADVLTEEHRRRYEDATGHLRLIASGKAGLVFTTPVPVDPNADPVLSAAQPIVHGGPPRLFSRDEMRDI